MIVLQLRGDIFLNMVCGAKWTNVSTSEQLYRNSSEQE